MFVIDSDFYCVRKIRKLFMQHRTVKSFMIQAFGPNFIKLFTTVINSVLNKLVSLLLSVTLTVSDKQTSFLCSGINYGCKKYNYTNLSGLCHKTFYDSN